MTFCPLSFTFWYFFREFGNCSKKHLFICSFEIFKLFSIIECNEVWNRIDLESLCCILCNLCIDSCKNKVWIIISFSRIFECWFNSHTWWAGWAPEINNDTWGFFDNLLKYRISANLENFTNFWFTRLWLLLSSTHTSHSTKPLH